MSDLVFAPELALQPTEAAEQTVAPPFPRTFPTGVLQNLELLCFLGKAVWGLTTGQVKRCLLNEVCM